MRLIIDENEYDLPLTQLIEAYRGLYKQLSENGIKLSNGKVVKLSDGLLRTGLKTLMTPFVIPMLNDLYKEIDAVIEPPVKHEDLIDYSVNALLDALLISESEVHVNLTSGIGEDSVKTVKSVVASRQRRRQIAPTSQETGSSENQ